MIISQLQIINILKLKVDYLWYCFGVKSDVIVRIDKMELITKFNVILISYLVLWLELSSIFFWTTELPSVT